MKLFIEIGGAVDSVMLWKLIERHNLNLTALDDKTWIYGEANCTTIGDVVSKCALFGDLSVKISKGEAGDEPKKTKNKNPDRS